MSNDKCPICLKSETVWSLSGRELPWCDEHGCYRCGFLHKDPADE